MSATGDELRAEAQAADACIADTRKAWETFGTTLSGIETRAKQITANLRTIAGEVDTEPTPPPVTPPPTTPPPASGWDTANPVYLETFSGTSVPSTFVSESTAWGISGGQKMNAVNRMGNASVRNGELVMVAKRDGPHATGLSSPTQVGWSTANLHTASNLPGGGISLGKGKLFEFDCTIPTVSSADKDDGHWPAVWMTRSDGGETVEFDVMEYFGGTNRLGVAWHGTYASGRKWGTDWWNAEQSWTPDGKEHRYAMEWMPHGLKWFMDGKIVGERTAAQLYPRCVDPSIKLRIRVGLQVGGTGSPGGVADAGTLSPYEFKVSQIRVSSWV